jgi:MinD superfamily P-loop ATPase
MNKLFKSLFLVCSVAVIFTVVSASAKDDLTSYLTQAHVIAGNTVTLTAAQKTQLERYLNDNTVTDLQVSMFKSKIEEIKTILNAAKITDPTKLTSSDKAKVINLIKDAGISVGVTVTVNSTNNTVELFDSTGAKLDVFTLSSGKLPFTGSDYILYDFVAIASCIIAMIYILKKRVV